MARRASQHNIVSRVSDRERERYLELFQHFDSDGSGAIDAGEVESLLVGSITAEKGRENVKRLISEAMAEGETELDFHGFLNLLERIEAKKRVLRDDTTVFRKILNKSGTGHVLTEDLQAALSLLGLDSSPATAASMMEAVDEKGEGSFTLSDYVSYKASIDSAVTSQGGGAQRRRSRQRSSLAVASPTRRSTRGSAADMNGDISSALLWLHFFDEALGAIRLSSMHALCTPPTQPVSAKKLRGDEPPVETVSLRSSPKALQQAVDSALPGTVIQVESGSTDVPLLVNVDSLTLVALGPVSIRVDSRQPAVTLRSPFATLQGFTLVNTGAGPAMEVEQGCPCVSDCVMTGKSGGCSIRPQSFPLFQSCTFTECRSWGCSGRSCKAVFDDCTFSKNHDAGAVVEGSANFNFTGCSFIEGKGCGVLFDDATGSVVESTISGNVCAGAIVTNGATPIFWKNKVSAGESSGICVTEGSHAHFEDNEFWGNEDSDIEVASRGHAYITSNAFKGGNSSGVHLSKRSTATVDYNTFEGYAFTAISIPGSDCVAHIHENTIHRFQEVAGSSAICIKDAGFQGRVIDNSLVGWQTQTDSVNIGVALSLGGMGRGGAEICGNIARQQEVQCLADKLIYMLSQMHG